MPDVVMPSEGEMRAFCASIGVDYDSDFPIEKIGELVQWAFAWDERRLERQRDGK